MTDLTTKKEVPSPWDQAKILGLHFHSIIVWSDPQSIVQIFIKIL